LRRQCNTRQEAFTVVLAKGEEMGRSFRFAAFRCAAALPLCWVACVVSNDVALAQMGKTTTFQAGCPGEGAVCPGGVVFAFQGNLEVVKNQPYRAQVTTENTRTLSDGSHIAQNTTAMIARDSEGRTVRSEKLSNGPTITAIFDPVAEKHIDYISDKKVAHVLPLPSPGTSSSGEPMAIGGAFSGFATGPGGSAVGFFAKDHAISSQPGSKANTTTQSLGTKTVEGIEVTGTRSTSAIPAGAIGNDEDLTTTREEWYSPVLKVVVQSTQNDPRFGQTTYTLSDIQQGPPDEALFQVPPDYKIEQIPMPKPAS
jgi:hypothetical protein